MKYVFIATVLLIFGAEETYGQYIQGFSVILVIFGAANVLTQHRKTKFVISKFEPLNYMLCIVIPFQSGFVSTARGNIDSAIYSAALLLTLFSVKILLENGSFDDFLKIHIKSVIMILIFVLIFEHESLMTALSVTQTISGLYRFSPFGNHPNLTGHIFGASASLIFGIMMSNKMNYREIFSHVILFTLCLLCIFSASSRGALLALFASMLAQVFCRIYTTKTESKVSGINRLYFIIIGSVACVFLIAIGFDYIKEILDFDSDYRGFDSGGSGRVDNWFMFFSLIWDNFSLGVFGNGLRTWDPYLLGFDSDNSYLNMSYEIGIFSTAVLIFLLIYKTFLCYPKALDDPAHIPLFGILIFILVESFVARYLLTIGNPVSFLVAATLLFDLNFGRLKN